MSYEGIIEWNYHSKPVFSTLGIAFFDVEEAT
jgi:hypothetical protein